jgi:hypothetical protein
MSPDPGSANSPANARPGAPAGGRTAADTAGWPLAAAGLRLVLPALWLGLIIGISLIEAPLKFQAPGITIPLGLGIGRLVFGAMNVVEIVIALGLLAATFGAAATRTFRWMAAGLAAVLAVKVALVRPLLNRRTDLVLAGQDDGGSTLHYLYIACDGVLILLLAAAIVLAVRRWARP